MQETRVWSLGPEDPLEKEMATHSSILTWKIPWTEEPGGLQSVELQELDTTEHNWDCAVLAAEFSVDRGSKCLLFIKTKCIVTLPIQIQDHRIFLFFNVINLTSVPPSLPMKNPVLDTDIITLLLYPRLSVQQAQNNNFITITTTTILSMDNQILVF